MNKYVKKSLKILAWIIGSIIGLFLLIVILIQIPYFQNLLKDQAVSYLENKIKTPVSVGRIEIGLPKNVIIRDVYFQSQEGDTLLAGEKLKVDISLFKLLDNTIEINSVDLQGITTTIKRNKDSVFNFDYIIDAFASNEPKDTTSTPMEISVKNINLDRIRVRFADEISKNDLTAYLHHFDTKITKFDLNKMDFTIPKINLDGFKVMLKQGEIVQEVAQNTVEVTDEAVKSPELSLELGEISLANIDVGFDNKGSSLNTGIKLKKLLVEFNAINLKKQLIDLDKFEIDGISGGLTFGKLDKPIEVDAPETLEATAPNWRVKLANSSIQNINFKFNDENSPKVSQGIDFKHLNISNLNLKAKDLYYSKDTIYGNIAQFSIKDQSGLDLQRFETDFFYGPKRATLKNLLVKTPQTSLQDAIQVTYQNISEISDNLGDLGIQASLQESQIGFKDILLFVPTLKSQDIFRNNPNAILYIDSKIAGKVNNLSIPKLQISGIGSTVVDASGKITGLPNVENAYFDLKINQLKSSAKDINMFVPKGTIPANIQIPSQLALNGFFKGKINNFNTDLNLQSSFGNAKIKALFDQRRKNFEKYDADAVISNFDLGQLLKNDSLGKISLRAKVKGTGLNPETANAMIDGKLQSAEFNRYVYRDLQLHGEIRQGNFDLTAGMNDVNLTFDLDAEGNFKGKYPAVKLKLNTDIADLQRLNLHAGPMKLRGIINADIDDSSPENLNGKIRMYNFLIADAKETYALDSIKIDAFSSAEGDSIRLQSQFLNAFIKGNYQYDQIGTALTNSIAKYYDANPTSEKKSSLPQQFDLELVVKDDPILYKLVPSLKSFSPINLTANYNSEGDSITVNGKIPKVIYGSNTITNGEIDVETYEDALVYSLVIDDIHSGEIHLPYTSISGDVKENRVNYTLLIRDTKEEDQYLLAGNLKAEDNATQISLEPDGLVLNYEPWDIDRENVVRFGSTGIYANNFELRNDSSSIAIQSQSEAANAPVDITLKDFEIATITSAVAKDTLLAGGKINGNVLLKDITKTMTFTADLNIDEFTFKQDTVGNIAVKVDNNVANTLNTDVAITGGEGNQVNLTGTYRTDNNALNMNLNIDRLYMKSIQGFTMGNITESTGFLSGDMNITGSVSQPSVIGELKFNEIGFRVKQLASYFDDMNDKISFTNSGINFNKFSVSDVDDNLLVIDGNVATTNYTDFGFGLTVKADNFKAVSSTAKDNDLYYGDLFIDTNLNVRGDLNKPIINGKLKINEDTDLTVVLPQSDPSIADREGIVEFIDQDQMTIDERFVVADSLNQSDFRGMDVSVNIEIVREAELTLVIDKGNGDYLNLKGEAQLTGGIDESGKTTLTGRYEFEEGAYEMSFNFIKRRFEIQKGSYILWKGEPMAADVNITAVYEIETAPIDLVDNQIVSNRNTFKQRIPFETLLKMNGELLKPEISFDIVLPEGNNTVSTEVTNLTKTKLAQIRQEPGELNKQVFALLLLGRFIGENPFASEAGGTNAGAIARQSVSKILSQQLNNLAADLVQGVELDFDLQSREDYTTGSREDRTDLNVGLSKRLLNDRLKVTVGSSFGLEGPQQSNEETTNIAGDISVDYQLTKDGRYMVRAYRKNQYQVALQGQVIETGVGFIITMDYNKFRELFHRTAEEKEMSRLNREKKQRQREKEKAEKAKSNQELEEQTNKNAEKKSDDE
ncbi:translocation/assembly module TamB [Flavobacterium sp. NST-5]|uniref:Translocation/assembly module TamB n=1 Tax=Flavobacterium ichthyis TaxID=2698827 RepID=A0ABW9Z5S0_9FLAO|nr:translocation/assembly module TamB [Flavobacterium ichthyis]NBL64178.1 translocation/assembly module TamB [Flavobacterium ichthyis]